jgi:hypothetical protein
VDDEQAGHAADASPLDDPNLAPKDHDFCDAVLTDRGYD